ncbi:MAG TPA: hypothetical protein VNI01_11645 [Elusimicrobiota bacterium]|nr:hypothetical protein [Elusimicrobiota bacterium]
MIGALAAAFAAVLLASSARAGEVCSYDASLCFSAPDNAVAADPGAFKGGAVPLLALKDNAGSKAITDDLIFLLTREGPGSAQAVAQTGLRALRANVGAKPMFHPDAACSQTPLRKDLTGYYYGNGCPPLKNCTPMRFLYFSFGGRVLKAACPPSRFNECRKILGSIRTAKKNAR